MVAAARVKAADVGEKWAVAWPDDGEDRPRGCRRHRYMQGPRSARLGARAARASSPASGRSEALPAARGAPLSARKWKKALV